jgi:hypothetical protein
MQLQSLPLTVFVNRKSGGKDGKNFLQSLTRQVDAKHVCDLLHEKPRQKLLNALKEHHLQHNDTTISTDSLNLPFMPVICCGGDGTIRWIMDEAFATGASQDCCFGILPMGTGNDLFNHILQSYHQQDRLRASRLAYQLSSNSQIYQTLRALKTFDLRRNPYYQAPHVRDDEAHLHDNFVQNARVISNESDSKSDTSVAIGVVEKNRLNDTPMRSDRDEYLRLAETVTAPYIVPFDRWEITVHSHSVYSRLTEKVTKPFNFSSASVKRTLHKASQYVPKGVKLEVPKLPSLLKNSFRPPRPLTKTFAFNNYFGIGIDGDIIRTFDNLRKQNPQWFFHRLVNKSWFAMVWLYKLIRCRAKNLSQILDLYVDDKKIDISQLDLRGIIFTNIASYAGGTKLWSFEDEIQPFHSRINNSNSIITDDSTIYLQDETSSPRWLKQSSEDGLLEVVGLTSWTHLASIKSGLGRAIPLAQGRSFRIVSRSNLPMQMDGEPWIHGQCTLEVRKRETVKMIIPQPLDE